MNLPHVKEMSAHLKVESLMIMPGEHAVSWTPVIIGTLLGSCVSACLWDRRLGIGGMNHFMLPDAPDAGSQTGAPLRYGLYAMERLVNDLLIMGSRRSDMLAKVFGGGNITGHLTDHHVGQRNATFVVDFLHKDGIRLMAQDLGGRHSRRIQFNTKTGAVKMQKLPRHDQHKILVQEKIYSEKIIHDPPAGGVEFF